MGLTIEPSGQACGAAIRGIDLRESLDPETVADIRAHWLEHKVLSFPDQVLTDEDQGRFTQYFGPYGDDPFFDPVDGHSHVAAIHRGADETTPLFAESWHSDWSFQAFPPDGTCLYGRIIPPSGGDTLFANQTAALANLPTDLRSQVEQLSGIHSARLSYAPDGMYGADDDAAGRQMAITYDDSAYDTQLHPLVRVHPETREPTLYSTIGYIIGIDGLSDAEARELLIAIYHHQIDEAVQYRHRWEPNMLVMWDNRCVLHRATGGYEGHERLLHRTTIGYNADAR